MIKNFNQLSEQERYQIFEFVNSIVLRNRLFDTYEEFYQNYSGPVFAHGEHFFSLWDGTELKATTGMIAKDVEAKDEIIVTVIYVAKGDVKSLKKLIMGVLERCREYNPARIKIGVRTGFEYMISTIEECGFKQCYEALRMRYEDDIKDFVYPQRTDLSFAPLTEQNRGDFLEIHNRSFVNSPNGGQMTEEEMDTYFEKHRDDPLIGVCSYLAKPVAFYEINLEDNVGWIDSLGVHPDYQGQGLGRMILLKSLDMLRERDIQEIKLIVMSANELALRMYERYGFRVEMVVSTWFNFDVC